MKKLKTNSDRWRLLVEVLAANVIVCDLSYKICFLSFLKYYVPCGMVASIVRYVLSIWTIFVEMLWYIFMGVCMNMLINISYKFFHIGNGIIKCTKIMFFHKNPNQLEKVFFYVWCKEYLLHWNRLLILGRKRFRSSSPVIAWLILLLVLIVLTTRVSCTICGSSSIGSYFFIYYF